MKNRTRLYNIMFPVWLLFLYPLWTWLVILPVNFGVDSLVLLLAARRQGVADRRALWKKTILRVWLTGFFCDVLGALACLGLTLLLDGWSWLNPYVGTVVPQILAGLPGVVTAGALIYLLNRAWSFRNTELTPAQVKGLCLALALFTAPYTMLIPLYF